VPFVPAPQTGSISDLGKELNSLWVNGRTLDPSWEAFEKKAWQAELGAVLGATLAALEPGPKTFFAACIGAGSSVKQGMKAVVEGIVKVGDYAWVNPSNFENVYSNVLEDFAGTWTPFLQSASALVLASDLVLRRCPTTELAALVDRVLHDKAATAALRASASAKAALVRHLSAALMASNPAIMGLAGELVMGREVSMDQTRFVDWVVLAQPTPAWAPFEAALASQEMRVWALQRLPETTMRDELLRIFDAMQPHIKDAAEMRLVLGRRFGVTVTASADKGQTVIEFDMMGLNRIWATLEALPKGHISETTFSEIVRKPLRPVEDKKDEAGKVVTESKEEREKRDKNRTFGGMGSETGQMQLGYRDNVDTFELTDSAALGAHKYSQADADKAIAAEKKRLDADKALAPAERKQQLEAFTAKQKGKVVDLGAINSFDHTVRHEVGHAVDAQLGISESKRDKELFGGWHSYTSAKELFEAMLAADATSKKAWEPVLAALPSGSLDEALKGVSTGVPGKMRTLLGDKLAAVEKTPIWGTLEALAGSGAQFSRKIPAVGAYRFTHDPSANWTHYSDKARNERGVSDYQWKAPKEWFAEVYAFYYDTTKPGELLAKRDPQIKTWLDSNVHQKGITPGAMKG